jgi:hypothetical protein
LVVVVVVVVVVAAETKMGGALCVVIEWDGFGYEGGGDCGVGGVVS